MQFRFAPNGPIIYLIFLFRKDKRLFNFAPKGHIFYLIFLFRKDIYFIFVPKAQTFIQFCSERTYFLFVFCSEWTYLFDFFVKCKYSVEKSVFPLI